MLFTQNFPSILWLFPCDCWYFISQQIPVYVQGSYFFVLYVYFGIHATLSSHSSKSDHHFDSVWMFTLFCAVTADYQVHSCGVWLFALAESLLLKQEFEMDCWKFSDWSGDLSCDWLWDWLHGCLYVIVSSTWLWLGATFWPVLFINIYLFMCLYLLCICNYISNS